MNSSTGQLRSPELPRTAARGFSPISLRELGKVPAPIAPGPIWTAALVLVFGLGLFGLPGRAGGNVAECTFEAFYPAVYSGGTVRLLCSGSIVFPFQVNVTTNTTISGDGTGTTLSGGGLTRLFLVNTGVHLTLVDIAIADGANTNGGAIYNNGGFVMASNCVFKANAAIGTDGVDGEAGANDDGAGHDGTAGGPGAAGIGGVFYNAGKVSLFGCHFEANSATGGNGGSGGDGGSGIMKPGAGGPGGGGGSAYGGAIYNLGDLYLSECTLATNGATAGNGGDGGQAGRGAGYVADSNGGPGGNASGGGIYSLGNVTIEACTFVSNHITGGNSADRGTDSNNNGRDGLDGGSAHGGAIYNANNLAAVNNTFHLNQATGGDGGDGGSSDWIGGDGGDGGAGLGGALYSLGVSSLTNCTFATNSVVGGAAGNKGSGMNAGDAGKAGAALGANLANFGTQLAMINTLLAGGGTNGNGRGPVVDRGHNLSSDSSIALVESSSMVDVDPRLGSYGDNGGETATLSLLADSPCIDHGATVASVTADQRGVTRPQGAGHDIGAFEREPILFSGHVWNGPYPVVGVSVSVEAATVQLKTSTDATGFYSFTNLVPGIYQILLPVDMRYTYDPSVRLVTVTESSMSMTNLDFHAVRPMLRMNPSGAAQPTPGVKLTGTGVPNTSYRIESGTKIGTWTLTTTLTSDAAGVFGWTNSIPAGAEARYYRAVAP